MSDWATNNVNDVRREIENILNYVIVVAYFIMFR